MGDREFLGAADGPGYPAVLARDEELRVAVLEERAALRVDRFGSLGIQRRHPQRVLAVEAPGKGQERLSVSSGADGADLNHRLAGSPRGGLPAAVRSQCSSRGR